MYKYPLFGALIAAAFAMPAQAEVVAQSGSAFVTKDSVVVSASPREVWLELISPGKWWNDSHTFSGESKNMMLMPKAGGCFCERIPAKDTADTIGLDGSVEHMRVILSIPDQALRMRGALGPLQSEPVNAVLTVTMAEAEEGTRIVFEYAVDGFMRFETPVIAKAVDGVISQQMNGLAKLLGPVEAVEEASNEDGADSSDDASENAADDVSTDDETDMDDAEDEEPKMSVDEAFGDLTAGDKSDDE